MPAQVGCNIGLVDAHAKIRLQRAKTEIEQDESRSSSRSACTSVPSSVSTPRRFIAQASSGRHSATR
jgi:hypothetical protein